MRDMSREVSAFFDDRYPGHARRVSSAVELPDGWVLAFSFESLRDNRGGAYTRYYATRVRTEVVLGGQRPNTANHLEQAYRTVPEAQTWIRRWFEQLRRDAESEDDL